MKRSGLMYRLFSVYGRGEEKRYVEYDAVDVDICYLTRRVILGLFIILAIISGIVMGVVGITNLISIIFTGIPFIYSIIGQISLTLVVILLITGIVLAIGFGFGYLITKIKNRPIPRSTAYLMYRAWKDKICFRVNIE